MGRLLFMKIIISCFIFLASMSQIIAQNGLVTPTGRVSIPTGNEKWDYMAVYNKQLFVSHGDRVHVLRLPDGQQLAEFDSLNGVHGIAIAAPFGTGYITNGIRNEITIFKLADFSVIKTLTIPGKKADAILYDAFSKRVFVFNNGSGNAVVIDPAKNQVIGQIEMGGAPEFAATNLKGSIFNNNEESNEVIEIDANTLKIRNRFSLAPNEVLTGLAIDIKNNRLFSVARKTQTLVVLNASNGKIIQTLPIGAGVDGVVYDAKKQVVVTSNGEGTATVVKQITADKYAVVQTLTTTKGQKTIALDEQSHQLFFSGASYQSDGKSIAVGTFGVSVFQIH
jgi:YVTN family beta-propeller protein